MAKIIETKAVITGEEKLSPLLDKLAKKFADVSKTAKSAELVGRVADQLNRVKTQLAAIEKYNAAKMSFANSRTQFRELEKAVVDAARRMREGKGDAAELESTYKRLQTQVAAASRQFENQKSRVMSARQALREAGVDATRLAAEQERLAGSIGKANAALDKQGRTRGRIRSAIGSAAGTAGLIAGPGILHGTKEALTAGANIQSEVTKMRAAGIPEEDIQRELASSAGLAAKYTNVKRSDILERYKELRSVLLHPEEASHLLETTVKANSAMNAIDRTGHMAEGLQFAVKGAEVLGLAQDPKRFEAYLDAFVKAQQVMGKTITPEQMFEFAKYTKASGATLSDRFKMTTGVSLSQEMGGSTTGVSVDQFIKQIIGGFQGSQHAAAKEFVALGLANKDDFEQTKTGEIKGFKPGRHVTGYQLAQTDPDKWIYQYLLPALEAKGYKSDQEQIGMVRRLFPSGRAADVVAKLITQRQSFENHAKLYDNAMGLNALGTNQSDPFVAFNSFTTSLTNFAATMTSPIMQDAAGVLSGMASSIGSFGEQLSKWQRDNPNAAKVAGGAALAGGAIGGSVLTYNLISGLMSGFGLTGSATALNASAVALTNAAVALGGSGAAKGATEAAGAAAGAAGGIWGKAVGRLAPMVPYIGAGGAAIGAGYGLWGMYQESAPYAGMTSGERMTQWRGGRMSDVYRKAFNEDRERLGIPKLGGEGGTVEAQLKGEAKVTGEAKITIDIPGLGLRSAMVPLSGTLGANGPGSLGTSSPDAAAHPVGTGHN